MITLKSNLVKLGELYEITSGGTPSRKINKYYNDGNIPWVKTGDLKSMYLCNASEYITDLGLQESSAKLFPKETVLIAMYGATIGNCSILEIEAATNQACAAFKPIKDILPEYLYYYLLSIKEKLISLGVGGAQSNISISILKKIDIPLISLDEQTKLVSILNKSQKLITKRKDQIEELNKLTQSVFLEMFGDVVRNPNNWDINKLEDAYEIIDGDRGKNYPKQDEFYEDEYCLFLNAGNVTANGFSFNKNMFITKEKDEILRKGKLQRYDLVITTRGTVGNIAYYDDKVPYENIRINSGMVILRKRKEINPLFFIYYFRNPSVYQSLISGTAQPQMPIGNLKNAKIYSPPIELQNQFADMVLKIDKQKGKMLNNLKSLEVAFTTLMQRAFKGELLNEDFVS